MPLLMCPNDNSAMQTMNRSGVEFDMCPSCRGVWLDRGELEKLMSAAGAEFAATAAPAPQAQRPQDRPPPQRAYEERRYDDDDRRRHHDDDDYKYRHKKRRGMDIFDIFD